ncbi:hypothetical protein CVS40_0789 [Lucilia cuprina]|nr:hypothetical protein CVS40_0789 [Lucilia cuprina]
MNLGENLGEIASDGSKINAVINSANFNILHFNAQSLVPRKNSTKFDEIRNLIMDCDIDAVGITETWYKEFIYDSAVSIPGFKLFRKDRSGCRGGGVCLYIRNNLKTGNIFDEQYDVNVESLFVEIILEHNSVALLGVIYLPNGQFLCCERVLENFSSRYNNIILMGDFNINLFINGAIVRKICERLSLYIVHNSLPTHYSPQQLSTSLIDFYLVSDIELVSSKHQFQIPALNSYHAAIFITYNISQFKNPDIYLCRDYSNLSYDQCLLQLESMNFSGVYDSLNVDESVECFNSNLNRLFEDNVPNRRVVKSVVHNWMNEECICSAKRIRDLTYRAYRENRSDRNFEAYRRARNRLKTIIRGVRRKYCLRFFSTCDQKQLWCKIKSIGIVKSPGNERFPISLNEFNEFSRMAGTADGGLDHLPSSEGFTFANVTETDVLNAVLSIKSQAVGADQIHIKFLKFIILPILKHLTFIINRVLTTSVVPKIWKVGRIVPIPKVKIPRNCSDYRPISILSVCSKVLELIIREQMLHHLNSCRKDLVFKLLAHFWKSRKLLGKLRQGFGYSSACKLIYSFLHGRSQFVQIEREVSNLPSFYQRLTYYLYKILRRNINSELDLLVDWSKRNFLQLNAMKCKGPNSDGSMKPHLSELLDYFSYVLMPEDYELNITPTTTTEVVIIKNRIRQTLNIIYVTNETGYILEAVNNTVKYNSYDEVIQLLSELYLKTTQSYVFSVMLRHKIDIRIH